MNGSTVSVIILKTSSRKDIAEDFSNLAVTENSEPITLLRPFPLTVVTCSSYAGGIRPDVTAPLSLHYSAIYFSMVIDAESGTG